MAMTLTVELEDTTLAALDRLADELKSPREGLIVRAVEDLVSREAWLVEKIDAGLAAADAGDFASDDDVARVRAKFTRTG